VRTPDLDLVSGAPFWPLAAGLLGVYPPLRADEKCDVAVIGAGITGALVAHTLTEAGLDVVVVDRRDVAQGSTAASTALLSWELDTELADLSNMIGLDGAVRAYRRSLEAIVSIERLTTLMHDRCGFSRRPSLYLATRKRDVARLQREAELRATQGLPSEFWSARRLAASSCFRAPGAIRSEGGGEIDPYRFTHALLALARSRGARIFDRTEIVEERASRRGVKLVSQRGPVIRAERAVMALGYEIPRPLRRDLVALSSTYVLITEPMEPCAGWEDRCLVWDSARPYTYMRWSADGRVLIGGEDEPFRSPARRDRLLPRKVKRLVRRLGNLLPNLSPEPAFAWTGTFGETKDGLPFVGEWAGAPGRIFALGYGGNGITFGVIAAEIVRDLCLGRPSRDAALYRLDR